MGGGNGAGRALWCVWEGGKSSLRAKVPDAPKSDSQSWDLRGVSARLLLLVSN